MRFVLSLVIFLLVSSASAAPTNRILRTTAEIRALSDNELRQGLPVEIEGQLVAPLYHGGCIIADSTLIERKVNREDIKVFYVPATRMATEMGTPTLANMILFGKFVKETGVISAEQIEPALKKVIPAKHADMLEVNLKAIRAGLDF